MSEAVTFRQVEGSPANDGLGAGSQLGDWYLRVRDTPIARLSLADLAVSVRQRLFLEHTVPVVLSALERDPLAGELYGGEMLVALKSVPTQYWEGHRQEAERLRAVLERPELRCETDLGDDLAALRKASGGQRC